MLSLIGRPRAAYSGTALAFRDRLVIEWNKTQQRQTFADQKRVYCIFSRGKEPFDSVQSANHRQIFLSNF
jgi:hypothetical protein